VYVPDKLEALTRYEVSISCRTRTISMPSVGRKFWSRKPLAEDGLQPLWLWFWLPVLTLHGWSALVNDTGVCLSIPPRNRSSGQLDVAWNIYRVIPATGAEAHGAVDGEGGVNSLERRRQGNA
ncbi:hypothetical protein MRX96_053399, partial [Rhipicephalus microplus]